MEKLNVAPIMITPNWSNLFEVMYDVSGVTLEAFLGQNKGKLFHPIYYASKELTRVQKNYTITEQDLLALIYAFKNFQAYLFGMKVVMHTDHASLRNLMEKKDTNSRLIK